MIGVVRSRATNIVHKRRLGRRDVIDDQFVTAPALYPVLQPVSRLLRLFHHRHVAGWALVGGLFFRHRLVVEPSDCLLNHSAWLQIAFGFPG